MTPTVRRISPARRAAIGYVAVFASGFGVMMALWLTGEWRSGSHGMPFYLSATVGDAVLLPVMVGLLLAALASPSLPPASHERRASWTAAAVGLVVGAAVQAAWLADPDPVRNWTMPRPGYFTLPGWYHAVFLVTMSGLFSALTVSVIRRLRHVSPMTRRRIARGSWIVVWLACGVGFLGLLIVDSSDSSTTKAGIATIATACGLLCASVGLAAWTARGEPRLVAVALGRAIPVAVAIVGVSVLLHPDH